MYIKFSEIHDGSPVSWGEVLDVIYDQIVNEYPEKTFVKIETDLSLGEFSTLHYYKAGWKKYPSKPSEFHVWDIGSESWLPDLPVAIAARQQEVASELTRRLYLPCNGFDADKTARERISGMIARLQRGDGLPAGWVGWRDAENHQHWAEDDAATVLANLTALSRAIEDREQALLVASWTHKANIAALTDIDAIIAYDVTANWPV